MMRTVADVLIAIALLFHEQGNNLEKPLEKPISFAVLREDLRALESDLPSADLWPDSKVIKYSDQVKIVVNHEVQLLANDDPSTSPGLKGENFLVVAGTITVGKLDQLVEPFEGFSNKIEVGKLLFHDGSFYFDGPDSEAVANPDEFYIVSYKPPGGRLTEKSTIQIEYITQEDLETELMNAVSRIRYEGTVTRALRVQSNYRTKNGVKLRVTYGKSIEYVIFRQAAFYILVMSKERDLVQKTVQLNDLSYDVFKASFPELSRVGPIYGVRITSLPPQPRTITPGLKVQRNILLRDMIESWPQEEERKDIIGMIKYDDGIEYVLKYVTMNRRNLRCLSGRFVDSYGTAFSRLCVEFPEGKEQRKSENWFQSSQDYTENPVFFTRVRDIEADIVLQDDSDYIELDVDASDVGKKSKIEPYVEYISFDKFTQMIKIVTDASKTRCSKSHSIESFRLFKDIFINFDCSTGMAAFNALDLWIGPGRDASNWKNLLGVSYDTSDDRFKHKGEILADFKVRQLHFVHPDNFPIDMKYVPVIDETYVAFDLMSVEWDMNKLFKHLKMKILPHWGIVRVDNSALFVAEKSEEEIKDEKKWTIKVKTHVTNDNCNEIKCLVGDEIIYDGHRMIMRSSLSNKQEQVTVPSKVYWTKNYKVSLLKDIFSLAYQVHYVGLTTLKKHMKELTIQLQKRSKELKQNDGNKVKLNINYFKGDPSIVGYYDWEINYILFTSDFKVIKLPNVRGKSTASGQENEEKMEINSPIESSPGSQTTPNLQDVNLNVNIDIAQSLYETEKEELGKSRGKYSDYIIKDLLYDPIENNFHSWTTFLNDVYAVRALSTSTHFKDDTAKKDSIRIKIEEGPEVLVFYDTVASLPSA